MSERILSIDVLRGLTILVMVFVNDVAGVTGTPAWLKHVDPSDADGMTFVDVVFPAFLFIVGMSIPLAIGKRLKRGQAWWQVEGSIVLRTLGLLVIGVFMINSHSIVKDGLLPRSVWILLVYLGILLVWNRPTLEAGWMSQLRISPPKFDIIRRAVGGAILVTMAVMYQGSGERSLIEMRPEWWGIIGLIGWAYFVASNVYLFARNRIAVLVAAIALLYCVNLADNNGFFPDLWILNHIDLGSSLASLPAVVVAGVVAGVVLSRDSTIQEPHHRIRWGLLYGVGLAIAAYLLHGLNDLHDMFTINKNSATVPWCLYSSAITIWIWVALYVVVDVMGWKRWTFIAGPAGRNPLFAYLLVPILYAAFDLWELVTGNSPFYWSLSDTFSTGCLRSIVLAAFVSLLAGGLGRMGIQPKL